MEPVYHTELDIKSLEYYDALRERQSMQGREEDMKKEIMALLKRHGLHTYESADGILVTLAEEEKVKVKKKKVPKEESDGEEFDLE
jgi:hypothetical protein